jgi:hypothetical protein
MIIMYVREMVLGPRLQRRPPARRQRRPTTPRHPSRKLRALPWRASPFQCVCFLS